MKRIISVILALALIVGLVSVLSGCNKKPEKQIAPGPLGKYDPPIKITYTWPVHPVDLERLTSNNWTAEENGWTEKTKEVLGIELELQFIGAAEYYIALTSAVAIGEIPDMVNMGPGGIEAFSLIKGLKDSELIVPLDDVYKEYASDRLKELMATAGDEIFYPGTFDGKLYAFPQVCGGEATARATYYFRKDWLDTLGYDVPTSYDELFDVFDAFTTQDPDSDGEANTVGMTICLAHTVMPDVLFNGFHAYPYIWIEKDGQLAYGSIQPEMKTALSKLNELYKKGTIDVNDAFSQDFLGGISGSMVLYTNSPLGIAPLYEKDRNADIVPAVGFSIDDKPLKVYCGPNSYRYYVMSSECQNPEVLIKFFNMFVKVHDDAQTDPELFEQLFYDETGSKHWYNYAPAILEDYPGRNYERSVRMRKALEENTTEPLINSVDLAVYKWVTDFTERGIAGNWGWNKLYGIDGSQELQGIYFQNNSYLQNKFYGAYTPSMELYLEQLRAFEYQTFTEIVKGDKPVEYFDAFVEQWLATGGEDITKEVNEWYASVKK